MPLSVGDIAPDFTLPGTEGEEFNLYESLKEGSCVVYFYPKDFTRGCTTEACGFRDNYDFFIEKGIRIVGISNDSMSKHEKFKKAYDLPFPLLSDKGGRISKSYKARFPIIGLVKRVTYLIGQDKEIKSVTNSLFEAEMHLKVLMDKLKK